MLIGESGTQISETLIPLMSPVAPKYGSDHVTCVPAFAEIVKLASPMIAGEPAAEVTTSVDDTPPS